MPPQGPGNGALHLLRRPAAHADDARHGHGDMAACADDEGPRQGFGFEYDDAHLVARIQGIGRFAAEAIVLGRVGDASGQSDG